MAFERQIAYKIPIKEILNAEYVKQEGWDPNYIIDSSGRRISKVNVIGVVLSKNEGLNFKSITVDDGTGNIEVRSFEEDDVFSRLSVGDIVLVIGKPRAFGSEKYIITGIVKKVTEDSLKLRKLELKLIEMKKSSSAEKTNKSEEVFSIIKELDEKKGSANINEVIEKAEKRGIKDSEEVIKILLENGDIFEISPGQFKIIE